MKNLSSAQKVIVAVAISIVVYIIGTIIFSLVTDSNGSAGMSLTFVFLYFGLPTFLILGLLSFAYFKEESKKERPKKETFASKSISPVRVIMIISGIVAAFVVIYIVWMIVSIAMTPQEPESIPRDYPLDVPSQPVN